MSKEARKLIANHRNNAKMRNRGNLASYDYRVYGNKGDRLIATTYIVWGEHHIGFISRQTIANNRKLASLIRCTTENMKLFERNGKDQKKLRLERVGIVRGLRLKQPVSHLP